MATKTLNQRVNEIVKISVSDKAAANMAEIKKGLEKELAENAEFQALVKAVNDFRLNYYFNDKKYKEQASANIRSAFRASAKIIKGINIPFEYTDNDKIVNFMLKRTLVDTDVRLASLICTFNERFEIKEKRTKVRNIIEWSEDEKAQILSLVEIGVLTEEEAKQKIANGKTK